MGDLAWYLVKVRQAVSKLRRGRRQLLKCSISWPAMRSGGRLDTQIFRSENPVIHEMSFHVQFHKHRRDHGWVEIDGGVLYGSNDFVHDYGRGDDKGGWFWWRCLPLTFLQKPGPVWKEERKKGGAGGDLTWKRGGEGEGATQRSGLWERCSAWLRSGWSCTLPTTSHHPVQISNFWLCDFFAIVLLCLS